jgi:hypothetical protein
MTKPASITAASTLPRRLAVTALVCALLGIASVMALAPGSASAAKHSCDAREFCMWFGLNQTGGLFEFSRSDRDLRDNRFENAQTDQSVNDNTGSVWNRGGTDPDGLVDVVVRLLPESPRDGATGPGLCIRQGMRTNLPSGWVDHVSSYRWVTHATCSKFRVAPQTHAPPPPHGPV